MGCSSRMNCAGFSAATVVISSPNMRKFLSLFILTSATLLPSLALAWSDTGHLIVAAEAYQQLSPELKAQVFEVLKSHPEFEKWQKAYHPNPTLDLPTTVFMRCAVSSSRFARGRRSG